MKFMIITFIFIQNAFALDSNLELLQLLTKSFSSKEIINSKSLCCEFNNLYNQLSKNDQSKFLTISCARVAPTDDAEIKAAKYLESVEAQINIIKTTSSDISNAELKIIVDSIKP